MRECELVQARDGNWIPLVMRNNERYYFGSTYNGEFAAKIWGDYYVGEKIENAILFGIGDCQIVNYLIHKIQGRLIVYEPDEMIYRTMKTTKIFRNINSKRLQVLYGNEAKEKFERSIVDLLNWDCLDTTVMLAHPGYKRFYEKEYNEAFDEYLSVQGKISELNVDMAALVRRITENELDNLPYVKNGIPVGRLTEYWDLDIPIIFIGAGPSLLKHIELLKKVDRRALLFCCDSALPILLKNGIVPDLVGTIDAMKSPSWFVEEKSSEIAHYVISCSCHDVVKKLKGQKIWGYDNMTWRILMKNQKINLPTVPAQEGVAPHLFAFIRELGSRQIIFVGHDLAYSDTGESHADGREKSEIDEVNIEMEGYYGGTVRSRPDWNTFRHFFESVMATMPEDVTVVNATEGGAKIHGMIQKPLSEMIEKLPDMKYDFSKILSDERVHLRDYEYEGIMSEFYLFDEKLKEWKIKGYQNVFFEQDFSEDPLIWLVLGYMKALNGEGMPDRKIRFERAIDITRYAVKKRLTEWGVKELKDNELVCEMNDIADCFFREQNEEGVSRFLAIAFYLGKFGDSDWLASLFDAIELRDYILAADLLRNCVSTYEDVMEVVR